MKQKTLFKRLTLSKQTVADLNAAEMNTIRGRGSDVGGDTCDESCPHYTLAGPDCRDTSITDD